MTRLFSLALACALPAAPQAAIRGSVEAIEDDERVPVAEAVIRAFVDREAVAVARSDREGLYTLEVPAESFELRLDKPGYVVASAGGLELERLQRACPSAGDCGTVDFLLERAAAVEVWVADPSGDPFPRARVSLAPVGARDDARKRGLSDDRGVARFYGLPPGRYRLEVQVGSLPASFGPAYAIDSAEINLRPGENPPAHLSARRADAEVFSLSGVIEGIEPEGANRRLEVRELSATRSWGMRQQGPLLNFPRLPKGEYVIELRSRGGEPPVLLGRVRLDGDKSGLVFRPTRLPTLLGRVQFEDGAPDFAQFELRSEDGWTWSRIRATRASPRFEVKNAPPGLYRIVNASRDSFLLEEPAIHLAEAGIERVQLTVSARYARVRGTIRGAGDAAVRVELSGPAGDRVQSTGPGNTFSFDKLPPGEYVLCASFADAPCLDRRRKRFPVAAGDEVELELGLPE